MRDDRLVYAEGYGGRGANERVDVWSLSKGITGVCIATLIIDGKLHLDDEIGQLLAQVYRKFGAPSGRMSQITVAQLLSHRSGLPGVYGDNKAAPGMIQVLRERSPQEADVDMLMPSIMRLKLTYDPGTKYEYSNVGYLLLGQIIESLTGKPYEAACGNRVLNHAGIKQPTLDPYWGHLTYSAGGWSLSAPEYLAFARLLRSKRSGVLTSEMSAWLEQTDGKWMDDHHTNAYTLGIIVHLVSGKLSNLFNVGAWSWEQPDAKGGVIKEKRGTYFLLAGDRAAWFASYDGVSVDNDQKAIDELDAALRQAHLAVSTWPVTDLFPSLGIGPVSDVRKNE
jgi:hypothetical protein